MTRINLVPVEELSDQHLIREYNELPRCIKQNIDTKDAPWMYTLGKGHMKWGKKHSAFLIKRYLYLCEEMEYRGFTVNYPYSELFLYHENNTVIANNYSYHPRFEDILASRNRIIEKYLLKPDWYRWTKRDKPYYLEK